MLIPVESDALSPTCSSFEDILLRQVTHKGSVIEQKRTRTGAEVLTSKVVIERLDQRNNEMKLKKKDINKKTRYSRRKNSKKNTTTKKAISDWSSTDEDGTVLLLHESDSDYDNIEELVKEYDEREDERKEPEEILKPGKWVLVEFATKKTQKYFIGQIVKIEGEDLSITFLRKSDGDSNNRTFVWSLQEDESVASENDIAMVLPEPNIVRRGQLEISDPKFHEQNSNIIINLLLKN
ncbi:hypothetical protein JTB14_002274 [Gonioctena quinquepunctata]|nr:hypothetical protein JTB14_002274 [Gonioctena quinquepunctata]